MLPTTCEIECSVMSAALSIILDYVILRNKNNIGATRDMSLDFLYHGVSYLLGADL